MSVDQESKMEQLLRRAFDPQKRFFGWTTVQRGLTVDDLKVYVDSGGNLNHRTKSGQTLLTIAADNLDQEVIEYLLTQGVDVNLPGHYDRTALHLAVDGECNTESREDYSRAAELPISKLLIDAGADETREDSDGQTARDVAQAYGDLELTLYDAISRIRSSSLRGGE